MPPESVSINIADIHFKTLCNFPLSETQVSPHYEPFLKTTPLYTDSICINVNISLADLSSLNETDIIYSASDLWSISRTNNQYLISTRGKWKSEPVGWDAFCDHDFQSIQIYIQDNTHNIWFAEASGIPALQHPLDQVLIMHLLSLRTGLLVHAAGAIIDNHGWLFPGYSGAGKSTLSTNTFSHENIQGISDEKIVVRFQHDEFNIYGTPWPSDAQIYANLKSRLSAICFITHDRNLRLQDLTANEALKMLLPTASIPWYLKDLVDTSLSVCERLVTEIPCYELSFHPEHDIANLLLQHTSQHLA